MRTRVRLLQIVTYCSLLAMVFGGCESPAKPVPRKSDSVMLGDLEVKYSTDGKSSVFATGKAATIAFSKGEVVIEKDRAIFDGKEVAKLPDGTKVVSVDFADKKLTIAADGKMLHEATVEK